jgi:CheY-like chemotaxis protein
VRVLDTGIGIAPAMLPKVFEMFAQGDRALERPRGGLGIGLTLVKSLVEMHGGTVTGASDGLGKGSEFTVRLPMVEPPPESRGEPAPAAAAARAIVRRRVLVVDDNLDAAESLVELLRLMGHDVRAAHDGVAAVAAAAEFRPDLALIDIGLPELNGYEVAHRIREAADSRDMLLVALTGYGQEEDRRKSREAGFDDHFVKPIAKEQLEALLTQIRSP